MLAKLKTFGVPIALVAFGVAAYFYGAHVERLKADEEIALMEKEYASRESSALREAERIRKQQEENYLAQIKRVNADNARIYSDALRVREQFNQLQGRRSPDLERCNNRAKRCEQLLSEAYDLAREGEGLLRERDARLGVLE